MGFYSVPVRWAQHPVSLKAFADRVELLCKQEIVAVHPRCWEEHKFLLNYLALHSAAGTQARRTQSCSAVQGRAVERRFARFRLELEHRKDADGTREFIEVLLLFAQYPEDRVKDAVKQCLRRRIFSSASVKGLLGYRPPVKSGVVDVSMHPVLQVKTVRSRFYDEEALGSD